MSRRDIADELLTLLAAGHETTAATLAWVFERIIRHPDVLARLEPRQRPMTTSTPSRHPRGAAGPHRHRLRRPTRLRADVSVGRLGDPRGYSIVVPIAHIHERENDYADPDRFDPQRFVGNRPSSSFIPYAGYPALRRRGVRQRRDGRGAANGIAALRNRDHTAPDEKVHSRGVAYTPPRAAGW